MVAWTLEVVTFISPLLRARWTPNVINFRVRTAFSPWGWMPTVGTHRRCGVLCDTRVCMTGSTWELRRPDSAGNSTVWLGTIQERTKTCRECMMDLLDGRLVLGTFCPTTTSLIRRPKYPTMLPSLRGLRMRSLGCQRRAKATSSQGVSIIFA